MQSLQCNHVNAIISYYFIQVDHAGRCCRVKWFRTYTEGAAPQPIYCSTTDASVYDLKDHPDFKFRPGSIVIRVMNKAGDDCGLGAGQVLDNQPSGQVNNEHIFYLTTVQKANSYKS